MTMGGNGLGTKRPRFWGPLDGNTDEKPCYCLRLTLSRAAFSSGFTLVCLDVNTFGLLEIINFITKFMEKKTAE